MKNSLPDKEIATLKQLHASGDRTALSLYILSLRAQLWSLQSIGDALGVNRSTVAFWEKNAPERAAIMPQVPLSHRAIETAGARTLKRRAQVHRENYETLRRLAQQAKKVNRTTPANSQLKQDADIFDWLIHTYLSRTVPITEIARIAGVSHRAIAARMERRAA